jgi:hypothetical protein
MMMMMIDDDDDDDDRYVCIDIMISCMYSIYSFIEYSIYSFMQSSSVMITHEKSFNAIIYYISVSSFIIIINTIIVSIISIEYSYICYSPLDDRWTR